MKKLSNKRGLAVGIALCAALCLGIAGCATPEASGDASGDGGAALADTSNAAEGSVIAYHEALGQDVSTFTEVSTEVCASACHGGSWDAIVESTDAMWPGIGQITEANPHDAHASGGYTCESCHSLEGTSIVQCNGCHNFEAPANWDNKDPLTTQYGVVADEPLF